MNAAAAAVVIVVACGVKHPPHEAVDDSVVVVLPGQLYVLVFFSSAAAVEIVGVVWAHPVHTDEIGHDCRGSLAGTIDFHLGVEETVTRLVGKRNFQSERGPPTTAVTTGATAAPAFVAVIEITIAVDIPAILVVSVAAAAFGNRHQNRSPVVQRGMRNFRTALHPVNRANSKLRAGGLSDHENRGEREKGNRNAITRTKCCHTVIFLQLVPPPHWGARYKYMPCHS